jgi:hypothetical protein
VSEHDDTTAPRRRVPVPVVAASVVLIVAAGVLGALAIAGVFSSDDEPVDAQQALLAAYERSRGAVFAATGTFTRTLPDGRTLESGSLVVQRPPDEIRRQLGGTSGRLNGRIVNCSTGPDGRSQCAEGADAGSWDAMVAKELENLRSYFDAERPAYTVQEQPGGCFELTTTGLVADLPYGKRAVMCFDPGTGAMRSIEIEHAGGAVDRLEAASIRATVSPEDFSLADDPAFASREGQADGD